VSVSVFTPRIEGMGEDLRALASEALVVYSESTWRDAMTEIVQRPVRSLRTLGLAVRDALQSHDATPRSRAKLPAQALAALGLARRLRREGIGHIHAHMANTPTTIAMYAAAQLGIGFSFTGHANDLFVHRAFLPEKLRRALFVSCISRWHREYYRRIVELPDARMPIIRCGVRTDRQDDAPNAGARPDSPIRILSVGRLVPKKGMGTLIRAIAALGAATPVRCEIIGDGPQRDELSSCIGELGLGDRVKLLGARPNSEVLDRVEACDVFVLACQRDPESGDQDGIPVSLMEAMAAGRCVITSALPPITELVLDGETGICVPENDAGALAAALRRAIIDTQLRQKLGRAGRAHVTSEFDRGINAERLAAHFRAALTAHQSSGPASALRAASTA